VGDQPDLQYRAVTPVASQLVEHYALLRHRREQLLIEPGLLAGKFRADPRERRAGMPGWAAHLLAGDPAAETGADARLAQTRAGRLHDDRVDLVGQVERHAAALAVEIGDLLHHGLDLLFAEIGPSSAPGNAGRRTR